jgi:DNA-directed RNA polymerase subunit H (RpoH/RPB5)
MLLVHIMITKIHNNPNIIMANLSEENIKREKSFVMIKYALEYRNYKLLNTCDYNPHEHMLFFAEYDTDKICTVCIPKSGEFHYPDGHTERFILITSNPITTKTIKSYEDMNCIPNTCICEYFHYAQLQVNVLHHYLVPRHKLLNQEQIQNMKKHYLLQNLKNELPKILRTDPVSVLMGLQEDDVVQIFRKDDQGQLSDLPVYRYCIDNRYTR